jgi:tagatose-6-phosphate ketose/aldose isomerase
MTASTPTTSQSLELDALGRQPADEQQRLGYADTLREILQQPATWRETSALLAMPATRALVAECLTAPPASVVLTGSGSSVHVGESVAPTLQAALGVPCQAIAAGTLLTHAAEFLPRGPGLLVSIARSGDSPESGAVVDAVLAAAPEYRHLVVTCNAQGRLATRYTSEPRLRVLLLGERTNDRSLVMTSSFTNLLFGTAALAPTSDEPARAADVAQHLLERYGDALAQIARRHYDAALYLGSGANHGAARECALKMLEMSGGAVATMAETFLGLRHGPMSALSRPTLVVALLSPRPSIRAYETDLLRELTAKRLGLARVLVGENIAADLVAPGDLAIDLPGFDALGPTARCAVAAVAGQLLAFFRCLDLGQRPDAPSPGMLTRVVGEFALHGGPAA